MTNTSYSVVIAFNKISLKVASIALVMSLTNGVVLAQDTQDHGQHQMTQQQRQSQHGMADVPSRYGQSQFSAIQEIVQMLEQDPQTSWSQVSIDVLRDHLIVMDLVMTGAEVVSTSLDDGIAHHITGEGEVIAAIQTMVVSHAEQMKTVEPAWRIQIHEVDSGVHLKIHSEDESQVARIRGLGFAGFMVQGSHHQSHHLMMATGQSHGAKEAGPVSESKPTHNH